MRRAAPVLVLAVLACASSKNRFNAQLPLDLPDVSRWETSSGDIEFNNPPARLEYRLHISPQRPMVYSVTRYRITLKSAPGVAHEKLQWDKDGKDVRRYECVPEGAKELPCRWEELQRGSQPYIQELMPILQVYNAHNAMLQRREGGR